MRDILVIRFSSLGDLCLLGASLARLAGGPGGQNRRITLVTKPAFASLMETVHGVDRVVPLAGSDWRSLRFLADSLRSQPWDQIIDAHNTLRSRLLLGMMGRRPHARLAKDTIARLAFLKFGLRSAKLEHTMSRRFDSLFDGLESTPRAKAETGEDSRLPIAAVPAFAAGTPTTGPVLGLAPGAQWEPKQWPEKQFAELLMMFRERSGAKVRVFLGPREERWFSGSELERTIAGLEAVEIHRGLSLVEIANLIAGCSLLVTNDSGLLHVAEAAGTPVLAFFGPTVREFGFFPRLPDSRVLEVPLDCRPCSRHGKRPCHRGDLACLTRITPARALEDLMVATSWDGPVARSGPNQPRGVES